MRLIHTSDWHLGHRFHGRQRHEEQGRFLDWLADLIETEQFDALLVAGDVFDTTTPGSRAQSLYYRFLHRLAGSSCRHVVIIGGNHDSPALLEAPRDLLHQLSIHVVGAVDTSVHKEILILRDADNQPELLVCAVPFLRDRDIRLAAAGETLEEKGQQQLEGIREHYRQICLEAEQQRQQLDPAPPLVVMGHLFVAGGKTMEGDGVRDLAIGGLSRIDGGAFADSIDYLALGHLHLGQLVAGCATRRYCGAPLPMSFKEASQCKQILAVTCAGRTVTVEPIPVPIFQPLASLRGDRDALLQGMEQLKAAGSTAWVELQYEGEEVLPNLRQQMEDAVEDSGLTILRIRNSRIYDFALQQAREAESLDDLTVMEVFERCLDSGGIEATQRPLLREALTEIIETLDEEDSETPAARNSS
ncbi:exonuclease SbcCD subunit D C-terminal domain-containing protein [Desulfobulbus alkaliphilus]|uniref:exonuclease SbcCD subunit D C-terminal domain-containing protein n=1 Tax=Desulfobulbus alkaliphilus TaxID=869814 RepID=UPI001966BE34|nr:exonuclease SbcCD subunit D C-terminal domain-containing protein [Desulfobulbus alkaliphilus]MBM9538325.1 exonuclease SbcCD subunit D C-terminal domain-containing protein [Desulfobulbus alkaliphilus]